jgi:hypothetical protein
MRTGSERQIGGRPAQIMHGDLEPATRQIGRQMFAQMTQSDESVTH